VRARRIFRAATGAPPAVANEEERAMPKTIDRDTLARELRGASPPRLVEALPERHFADAHLPGAVNIPHDAVDELAATLLPDRAAPVVVYCASASCRNSDIAAARLERLGYSRVRVYAGGKQDWVGAGLPVERGQAVAA
jgi:rhodanese-related sulfurtransferase